MKTLRYYLALAIFVVSVSGHGRVLDPPSRATMWRKGYATRANYDDNGLNCGGFYLQHNVNGGKCGICGDAWDAPQPRPHEIGGEYGQGIIVAEYQSGQVFTAAVEITAYHKGYWYFNLCTDYNSNDQSCFEKYPLELEGGGYNYYPPGDGTFYVNYRLPRGLVCEHCVLQWRWRTGNRWGDCGDGTEAIGCGDQENFGACSDISIKAATSIEMPVEISDNL